MREPEETRDVETLAAVALVVVAVGAVALAAYGLRQERRQHRGRHRR